MSHTKKVILSIILFASIIFISGFCNAANNKEVNDEDELKTAISEAAEGDIIQLKKDIVLKAPIEITDKNITINGNGNAITRDESNWTPSESNGTLITAGAKAKLELISLTLKNSQKYGVQAYNGGYVSLNGVTILNCGYGAVLVNGGTVEVKDLTLQKNGTPNNNGIEKTTKEPRFGNPTPRIAECTAGMINSVGLQNPGVHGVIEHELPRMREYFHKPVMANVGGFSAEEYAYTCALLDKEGCIGWIEINVSCPNVHAGGRVTGSDACETVKVLKAVKAVTSKPVIVKLSPNVTDIVEIAHAVEDAGADGISLINTLLGMRIDKRTRKPVIANTMGGFSGPAIFPVALRMVYQVARAVRIPVIGMGGVSTAEDVIEMMLAGATAVGVGAANLVDPYACRDIIEALPAALDKYGIGDIKDIIGGAL